MVQYFESEHITGLSQEVTGLAKCHAAWILYGSKGAQWGQRPQCLKSPISAKWDGVHQDFGTVRKWQL